MLETDIAEERNAQILNRRSKQNIEAAAKNGCVRSIIELAHLNSKED
jgi:hypothetical protein